MVVVFWYICILFYLYFVPFVLCCNCILLHLYFGNLYFVLLYFVVFVFWNFCILFYLYFVPFVFWCICILLHLYFGNLYFVLLYFVVFVFWNFCILSCCILLHLVVFCSVCIMEYLYFDWLPSTRGCFVPSAPSLKVDLYCSWYSDISYCLGITHRRLLK